MPEIPFQIGHPAKSTPTWPHLRALKSNSLYLRVDPTEQRRVIDTKVFIYVRCSKILYLKSKYTNRNPLTYDEDIAQQNTSLAILASM